MKALRLTVFSLWMFLSLYMASCTFLDHIVGPMPDGSVSPTSPVSTGAAILGGILTPLGFGWVSSAILAASHVYAEIRAKNWKGAAFATASGVQDAIGKLDAAHAQTPVAPAAAADIIKASVDAAHDAAGVPQAIQNVLAPVT